MPLQEPTQTRYNDPYSQLIYDFGTIESKVYLAEANNQNLQNVGSNIKLTGIELTPSGIGTTDLTVDWTEGWCIVDDTLIFIEAGSISFPNASSYSPAFPTGNFLLIANYRYLQIVEENPVFMKLVYHNSTTETIQPEAYDSVRDNLIVGVIQFSVDGVPNFTSLTAISDNGGYFTMDGEDVPVNGWNSGDYNQYDLDFYFLHYRLSEAFPYLTSSFAPAVGDEMVFLDETAGFVGKRGDIKYIGRALSSGSTMELSDRIVILDNSEGDDLAFVDPEEIGRALSIKATPVNADRIVIGDSAAGNELKLAEPNHLGEMIDTYTLTMDSADYLVMVDTSPNPDEMRKIAIQDIGGAITSGTFDSTADNLIFLDVGTNSELHYTSATTIFSGIGSTLIPDFEPFADDFLIRDDSDSNIIKNIGLSTFARAIGVQNILSQDTISTTVGDARLPFIDSSAISGSDYELKWENPEDFMQRIGSMVGAASGGLDSANDLIVIQDNSTTSPSGQFRTVPVSDIPWFDLNNLATSITGAGEEDYSWNNLVISDDGETMDSIPPFVFTTRKGYINKAYDEYAGAVTANTNFLSNDLYYGPTYDMGVESWLICSDFMFDVSAGGGAVDFRFEDSNGVLTWDAWSFNYTNLGNPATLQGVAPVFGDTEVRMTQGSPDIGTVCHGEVKIYITVKDIGGGNYLNAWQFHGKCWWVDTDQYHSDVFGRSSLGSPGLAPPTGYQTHLRLTNATTVNYSWLSSYALLNRRWNEVSDRVLT